MPDKPALRLEGPAGVIRHLPHLLGFAPTESLVVVGLSDDRVVLTLRTDIPAPRDTGDTTSALAERLVRAGATTALVLLIGVRRHRRLASAVGSALQRQGLVLDEPLWAADTRPGSRWSCLCDRTDCALDGVLPDDTDSYDAAMAVKGVITEADRAAVLARVAPARPEVLARRADCLAAQPADDQFRPSVVVAALALHELGGDVDDQLIVDMVHTVRTSQGFSAVMSLAMRPTDRPIAEFLLMLTRETPTSHVGEIAALAGLAQYLAGDGMLARAVLERSLQADPSAPIPRALLMMLDQGMPPGELRAWLTDSDT